MEKEIGTPESKRFVENILQSLFLSNHININNKILESTPNTSERAKAILTTGVRIKKLKKSRKSLCLF